MKSKVEDCEDTFASAMPEITYDQKAGEVLTLRVAALEEMLIKKLDLIRCGIGSNYSGYPQYSNLYTEVIDLLNEGKPLTEYLYCDTLNFLMGRIRY